MNAYYRNFATVILRHEPIDVTMELVSNLVPHVWTPMIQFYILLLNEVQVSSIKRDHQSLSCPLIFLNEIRSIMLVTLVIKFRIYGATALSIMAERCYTECRGAECMNKPFHWLPFHPS